MRSRLSTDLPIVSSVGKFIMDSGADTTCLPPDFTTGITCHCSDTMRRLLPKQYYLFHIVKKMIYNDFESSPWRFCFKGRSEKAVIMCLQKIICVVSSPWLRH